MQNASAASRMLLACTAHKAVSAGYLLLNGQVHERDVALWLS